MKKLAKIFFPIAILALLLSMFAFASFAEGETVTTVTPNFSASSFGSTMTDATHSYKHGEQTVTYRVATSTVQNGTTANPYYNIVGQSGVVTGTTGDYTYNAYYQVYSFDVATESNYIDKSTIILKFLYQTETGNATSVFNTSFALNNGVLSYGSNTVTLESDPLVWNNISLVFDYENAKMSIFVNGKAFVTNNSILSTGCQLTGIEVVRPTIYDSGAVGDTLAVTNYTRTSYTEKGYLASLFDGTVTDINGSDLVLPYTSPADLTPSPNEAKIGDTEYATAKEAILDYTAGGDPVVLLRNVKEAYQIDKECVIDTNGYEFPVSTTLNYYSTEADGVITVKAFDPSDTVIVSFVDNKGVPFPEYANGGLEIPLGSIISEENIPSPVLTGADRFYGWSYTQGGDIIEDDLYVDPNKVVDGNLTFYAIMTTPKMVVTTGGVATEYEEISSDIVINALTSAPAGSVVDIYESVTLTGSTMTLKGSITLNLYGSTVTWNGSGNMFNGSSNTPDIIGHDVGEVKSGLVITSGKNYQQSYLNNTLYFKNIKIECTSALIDHRRQGSAIFEDCVITCNTYSGTFINLQQDYSGATNPSIRFVNTTVNLTAGTSATLVNLSAAAQTKGWSVSLEGATVINSNSTQIFKIADSTAGTDFTIRIGKDVVFTNGNLAILNNEPDLKLSIEEGFSIATLPVINNVSTITTFEGVAGEFNLKGDKYVFSKPLEKVTISTVVNGVTNDYEVVVGDTTAINNPEEFNKVADDGRLYIYTFSHWSLTEGGEATEIDFTKAGTYYAVFTRTLPKMVVTAGGVVTVYKDAQDFTSEAVINALSSAPAGSVIDIYESITLTGSTITLTGAIEINLYGATITWSGNGNMFSDQCPPAAIIGHDVDGVKSGLSIPNRKTFKRSYLRGDYNTMRFENLTIYTESCFIDNRGGIVIFENCDITMNATAGYYLVELMQEYSGFPNPSVSFINTTVNITNQGFLVKAPSHSSAKTWSITLEGNTQITTNNAKIFDIYNSPATDTNFVFTIGKDVVFTNGNLGIVNSEPDVKLSIEEGFSIATLPVIDNVSTVYTFEGVAGEFILEDGKYVFSKLLPKVTITTIVNGLTTEHTVIVGDTSAITNPAGYNNTVEGKLYIYTFSHWSLTEGGEATEIDFTKAGTYYAVFTETIPTYVIYNVGGEMTKIGDTTVIVIADVTANPGGRAVLYSDVTFEVANKESFTVPFTFDINSYKLTVTDQLSLAKSTGALSTDGTSGLAFKNGTVNVVKNLAIVEQWGSNNAGIYFEKVTVNVNGTLVDYRGYGSIKMVECIVNFGIKGDYGLFAIGAYSSNPTFEFIDTDFAPLTEDAGGCVVYLYSKGYKRTVSVTFDGCDILLAQNQYLFITDSGAAEGSVFNVTLNDTKLTGNADMSYKGGDANLATTVTLNTGCMINSGIAYDNAYVTVKCADGYALLENASGDYKYTVVKISDTISLKASLTLYNDITLNFFVPTDSFVKGVKLNGVLYVLEATTLIDGVPYYRISVPNISVVNVDVIATLEVICGALDDSKAISYSVIDYLETALPKAKEGESRALIAHTICYINEAYSYDGATVPERLTALMGTQLYKDEAAKFSTEEVPESTADVGNIIKAISTVQLNLASNLKFRFNLQTDYSGVLTINGNEYTVEKGEYDGEKYIEVSVYAYKLSNKYIIISDSVNGIYGQYDLKKYIHTDKTVPGQAPDTALEELLTVLYNYAEAARKYEETKVVD